MFGRGVTALVAIGIGAGAAAAADLDYPPISMAQPPIFASRWEGFYVGPSLSGVYAPNQSATDAWFAPYADFSTTLPQSSSSSGYGGGVGVLGGFDRQIGSLVICAVADYDFLFGLKTTSSAEAALSLPEAGWYGVPLGVQYSQQLQSMGTLRARIGTAIGNDWLIYGTGGLAYGSVKTSVAGVLANGYEASGSRNGLAVGYVIGAGAQYAFAPDWSIGLEALYYNLGAQDTVGWGNYVAANLYTGDGIEGPELDEKSNLSGFELRLSAIYELGDAASAPHLQPSSDPNTDMPFTIGMRAGVSSGRGQMTLYDGTGAFRLSRLTYTGATAPTVEPYVRIDVPQWNLFATGYVGLGAQIGGNLQDEDWPPGLPYYSSTNSPLADGTLQYGTFDAGWYALNGDFYHLGALAGFTFQNDNYNAFGCTSTSGEVCPPGLVAANDLTISDAYNWKAARLGLAAKIAIPGSLTITADAAWLPWMSFSETNYHWLRMPGDFISGIPGVGSGGMGYQLEAEASYPISPNIDFGAGVRYSSFVAKGHINFQYATDGGPQVATFDSQRLQAFLETGFHF